MESPFIHLLRSPYACYFFDVNTNSIVMVSEEAYAALHEITKTGSPPPSMSADCGMELQQLKEQGYLSSKRVKEIEHPLTQDLDYILSRKVGKVTLQLTQSCNLRCAYCIYSETTNDKQRKHSGKRMSWETAKAGIDFLAEHSIDSERVNVGFYGGEPLLEFELLKKATIYAEERFEGRDLAINLTSNATLLNDEILEFFAEHDIHLTISLDGPKSIHDRSRCFANGGGTFDTVMFNLQYAVEKFPEYAHNISINMVMDPRNSYDCLNDFIVEYDVFQTAIPHASPLDMEYSGEQEGASEQFLIENTYDHFLGYLKYFRRLKTTKIPYLAQRDIDSSIRRYEKHMKHISTLPDKTMHGGPCIPGQARLFINTDGDFYPCERVSELSDSMRIGNLKNGFDLNKSQSLLNIGQLTAEQCKNCWAINHCGACAKKADSGLCLSGEIKQKACQSMRRNVESDIRAEIMRREIKGGMLK